jgi:hypothetical protein
MTPWRVAGLVSELATHAATCALQGFGIRLNKKPPNITFRCVQLRIVGAANHHLLRLRLHLRRLRFRRLALLPRVAAGFALPLALCQRGDQRGAHSQPRSQPPGAAAAATQAGRSSRSSSHPSWLTPHWQPLQSSAQHRGWLSSAVIPHQRRLGKRRLGTTQRTLVLPFCRFAVRPACSKKDRGGINFTTTVKDPKMDLDAVKSVCSEYR